MSRRPDCDDDWLEQPDFEDSERPAVTVTLIWLLLAGEGGWWRTARVLQRLPYLDPRLVGNSLWVMAHRHGQLATRQDPDGNKEYGVTFGCRLPRELTAGAAAKALARRFDLHGKEL